jgi:hypothetical protein
MKVAVQAPLRDVFKAYLKQLTGNPGEESNFSGPSRAHEIWDFPRPRRCLTR